MSEPYLSDRNVAPAEFMVREAAGSRVIPTQWRAGLGEGEIEFSPSASRMRVVIVDDQFTGRRILRELLVNLGQGLEVVDYSDPQKALADVRNSLPDLIVTDYRMPGMNGTQFIRAVRALPGGRDVPIVVVTVLDDRKVRYEALEAGATDFISRPLDSVECRARCRNLLQLRRQGRLVRKRAQWLEQRVHAATQEVIKRERETLFRLARAGEYRDEETGNHVLRIARYARCVAHTLGLDDLLCETIELAAPMHDIGKIGIPDRILLKPGQLDPEEREIMMRHASIGHEILMGSDSRYIEMGAVIALSHHERWDGGGYPSGLIGEDIPLPGRIVAVVDVYDALRSNRPYKSAWSREAACGYLREQSGRHFDPACVSAFMKCFQRICEVEESLRDIP